jgi:hypothetical protein
MAGSGLTLPSSDSVTDAGPGFAIENDGTGAAIAGLGNTGSGVAGSSKESAGVNGEGEIGPGVSARSRRAPGVLASSRFENGVVASSEAAGKAGVIGVGSDDGFGVVGYVPMGNSDKGATGVLGDAPAGVGVAAHGGRGEGVLAFSDENDGIGAFAKADGQSGVFARNDGDGWGVFGYTPIGFAGVLGSGGRNGVFGQTVSDGDSGVFGRNDGTGRGVSGFSSAGVGVEGVSDAAAGVHGRSSSRAGVKGYSDQGNGVAGASGASAAAVDWVFSNVGVLGSSEQSYAVAGFGFPDSSAGVMGWGGDRSPGILGLCGEAKSAGLFIGNVAVLGHVGVLGDLDVTGYKHFRIDHPIDPANRFLKHAAVESAQAKNLYDGAVVLDAAGEAEVVMPDWFERVNTEFCYQLTGIGAPTTVFIAAEIVSGRFRIAGGTAGQKVCWQVTARRSDPWARTHPFEAEEDKAPDDRGTFVHPEFYREASVSDEVIQSNGEFVAMLRRENVRAEALRERIKEGLASVDPRPDESADTSRSRPSTPINPGARPQEPHAEEVFGTRLP